MSESPAQEIREATESKNSDPKKIGVGMRILRIIVLFFLVIGAIWAYNVLTGNSRTPTAGGGRPRAVIPDLVGQAIRSPQTLIDKELKIDAGAYQGITFELPSPRPVLIEVERRSHADKGYGLYLMNESELKNFKPGEEFKYYPAFSAEKILNYRKKGDLPAGRYSVIVFNSENLLNAMTISLKVVVDPDN